MSDYRWSLGTLIWLPVGAVMLVVCLGLTWWLFARVLPSQRKASYGEPGAIIAFGVLAVVSAALLVGGTALCMWPYKAEYHQWRETSGTVESIDSRLIGADKSTTERFVVTFTDGRQRSCDDTRCAQVDEGDDLTLACKRAWQWSGSHGYDCNYVSHEATR